MESCSVFDDLLIPDSPTSSSVSNVQNGNLQWCDKCINQAQEVENGHKKSVDMIKEKILFTDHLIGMYTQMKSSVEESQARMRSLELECKRKDADNLLVSKQLKALLADNDPNELQQVKDENANLKLTITNLDDQLSSYEMTKKFWEDKITSLNKEAKLKETENKSLLKEKEQLLKDLAKQKKLYTSCERENLALSKKNEVLQERLRRRRSRGSGSFSHTTDSDHNLTAASEDFRVKNDEHGQKSLFKSPSLEKKKKRVRKRRKSLAAQASDDEDATIDNQDHHLLENEQEHVGLEAKSSTPEKTTEDIHSSETTAEVKSRVGASSSDSANETKTRNVASASMKARLIEMKKMRAYRSFCSHPSNTQLKEISEFVERFKDGDGSCLKEDFFRFCSKHYLTGHESYVARKIERLHQKSLNEAMIHKLRSLLKDDNETGASPSVCSDKRDSKEIKEKRSKSTSEAATSSAEQLKVPNKLHEAVVQAPSELDEAVVQAPSELHEPVVQAPSEFDEAVALSYKITSPLKTAPIASSTIEVEPPALSIENPPSDLQTEAVAETLSEQLVEELFTSSKIDSVALSPKMLNAKTVPIPSSAKETFEVEFTTSSTKSSPSNIQIESVVVPTDKFSTAFEMSSVELSTKAVSPITKSTSVDSLATESSVVSNLEFTVLSEKLPSARIESVSGQLTEKPSPVFEIESVASSPKVDGNFAASTAKETSLVSEPVNPLAKKFSPVALEAPPKLPMLETNLSSMFSSEDEDCDEPVVVNICSTNDPDHEIPSSINEKRKTRSNSRSSKSRDDKKSMKKRTRKSQLKIKRKLKRSKIQSSDVNAEVSLLDSAASAPLSSKISSLSEFSTDSDESDSIPLSVLVKRTKVKSVDTSAPSEINQARSSTASDDLSVQSPASTAPPTSVHEAKDTEPSDSSAIMPRKISGTANVELRSSKRKKLDSPPVDKKVAKTDEVMKDVRNHESETDIPHPPAPVLKSFQSMPFSVDPDIQSSHVESQSHSFLPASVSNLDLSESSDDEARSLDLSLASLSPSKLHGIFQDVSHLMDVSLLSPLQSDERRDSSDPDDAIDVDDRCSISPSADLCTAINFPSVDSKKVSTPEASSSGIVVTGKEAKQSGGKMSQSPVLKDAPRRFSCEAPVLARTVPTLKRVCKAQSLDPSVLSSIDESPSKTCEVSNNDAAVAEASPTSKILPSNLKIIPGSYSGPFKVVSPHSDSAPIRESSLFSTDSKSSAEITANLRLNVSDSNQMPTKECRVILNSIPQVESSVIPTRSTSSFVLPEERSGKSSLNCFLEEIQSYAFLNHPAKTFPATPTCLIVDWLTTLLPHTRDHKADELLASRAETNDDLSTLQPSDVLHEAEYKFVTMMVAVDQIRARAGREVIKPLLVPIILKLLCRFGFGLHSLQSAVKDVDASKLEKLLVKGHLEANSTRSLVRLLSCFCRTIASPDVVLDFCRYAIVSKSLYEIDSLLYECVACYPDAFSKHFPLSGNLLVSVLAGRADKHIYALKSDAFKEELRVRVRHLESLLGWKSSKEESLTVEKVRDASSQDVLKQCLQRIATASFVDVTSSEMEVALAGTNLSDVFIALEFFAVTKAVLFVTVEIIDRKFWPLLNSWSRHLVTLQRDVGSKKVTDASITAVLHGITSIFLSLATHQQITHPLQPLMKQLVAYFETMCSLLANFTARHLSTAPRSVQCATATTVLKLAFFKPLLAYKAVHGWLEGTNKLLAAEVQTKRDSRKLKGHPCLAQITVFYPDKSLKKMVAWLESRTKSFRREKNISTSLTTLIWG